LTLYVLAHFEEDLERLGLYEAVRATCCGIQMSVANFYAIFELYCPATRTFFTPVANWAWLCTRCGKTLLCPWDLSLMKNISHARRNWYF